MKCENSVPVDSLHEGQVDIVSIFDQVATLKNATVPSCPCSSIISHRRSQLISGNICNKSCTCLILRLLNCTYPVLF